MTDQLTFAAAAGFTSAAVGTLFLLARLVYVCWLRGQGND